MFFPESIGLSIQGNDLIISKTSQIFIKPSFESTVVKDFLLKESLDLKLIISSRGFQTRDIILSWPRERTIVREIELPGLSLNDLRETLSYQLDSFILFSEDDVYYDIYPSNSAEYGEKVFVFAIKKEELDDILFKLESSNLIPGRVIISPLSYTPLVNDNKVVVVEKFADKYTFNLYIDSKLVSTSLVRSEDALKEKIYENKPDDVIFLGHEYVDVNDLDNDDIYVECWEESKQSLGAALNGLSECLNRFNVLKVKGKRHIPQYALTGILVSLILAFIFILPGIFKNKREQSILAIDAKLEELYPEVMISNRLRDEIDSVLAATNKINEVIRNKSLRIDLLAELTTAIPDDTWVKQLSIKNDGFAIEGVGLSGAKVLTLLEHSPRIDNVSFTSSVTKGKIGKEKFKIKGNIK
jgi:Tfp pilus assembly protein PilN